MIEEFDNNINEINSLSKEYLMPSILSKIDECQKIAGKFYHLLNNYLDNFNLTLSQETIQNFINNFGELKEKLKLFLDDYGKLTESKTFDEDFKDFLNKTNKQLSDLPIVKVEFQSQERFNKAEGDSQLVGIGKFFKRILFKLSQLPLQIGKFFRIIFKRKLNPPKQWKQKIPVQNLITFYLRDEVALLSFSLIKKANKSNSIVILKLWKEFENIEKFFIDSLKKYEVEDEQCEIKKYEYSNKEADLKKYLEDTGKDLQQEFERSTNKILETLNHSYEKAGTIEIPASRFSNSNIENKHDEVNKKYTYLNKGWANTFYALFEDWKLNLVLYLLRNTVLESYFKIQTKIKRDIVESIIPEFKLLLNRFERLRIDFNRSANNRKKFKGILLEGGLSVLDQLKSHSVPRITELLLELNISLLIDELENISKNAIKEIAEKRAIVKTDLYDEEIKYSDIDFVSPKEIILFDGIPEFIDSTKKVKNQISNELHSIQNDLDSLIEIFNFNLESAEAAFENEKNTIDEVKDISIEGIDRTISNALNINSKIENLNLSISDVLKRAVDEFNINVTELTRTEKIFEIKLRIAKAKAKQKTLAYKKHFTEKIKALIPSFFEAFKKIFGRTTELVTGFSRFIGVSEKPKVISSEISDFLVETQSAVELLPFVYKRLFRIEPLDDERFFIQRVESKKKFQTALSNWQKERFACCAVIGEKGSGSTTLINFLLREFKPKYQTFRIMLSNNICDEESFFSFMGNLFGNKEINNLHDMISHLNSLPEKRIIIIENIQHLYLRFVGGFKVLKMIFELISKTNKNIFWVMSSTLYAWEYLNKTINISDQFGYVIHLEEFTEEQIKDVIFKRHKVSGYNIYFEPGEAYLNKKSFQRLKINEKQEILKKEFFSNLYKFSKSNLSLALLYWLRTTKEVSGDTITIGVIEDLDYSFLDILSQPKILTLYFLLIHDGLSIDDHSRVFNCSIEESKLILLTMSDDGLLIKKEEMFNINPFLYRQIVNVLMSKNFIH